MARTSNHEFMSGKQHTNSDYSNRKGTRQTDAASSYPLRRLPNRKVHSFGQVFGEIKRITLHGSVEKKRSENGIRSGK